MDETVPVITSATASPATATPADPSPDASSGAAVSPAPSVLTSFNSSSAIVNPVPSTRRVSLFRRVKTGTQQLLQRFGAGPDRNQIEPTVEVEVFGAEQQPELAANLRAALTRTAIAELDNLQDSLPRLRRLSLQAAEAVGYYQPVFRYAALKPDTLQVFVDAGEPVMVTRQTVDITGAATQDEAFTQLALPIRQGDRLHHGRYEQAKAMLNNLTAERGYFDRDWQTHDVEVHLPANTADITLALDSGQRYRFGDITFFNSNGDPQLPVRPELLAQLTPFKSGEPFDARLVGRLTRNLQQTRWFNTVLIDVQTPPPLEMRSVVGESPDTADADGAPVAPATPDSAQGTVIDGAAPQSGQRGQVVSVPPAAAGQPASAAGDETGDRDTPDTPAVQAISARDSERQGAAANAQGLAPVRISLNAQQPTTVEAGIGYGTDTRLRGRAQFRRNLINDRGHSLEGNLELSRIRRALDVRYNLPYRHPLNDTLTVLAGYEYEQNNRVYDGFTTDLLTVGVQRNLRPEGSDWNYAYWLRYRLDQFSLSDGLDGGATDTGLLLGSTRQQTLLLGGSANKLVSNDPTNPTRGYRLLFQADAGSDAILSDTNLLILKASARGLYTTPDGQHQLTGRLDGGHIWSGDFSKTPPSLRFFAGGDQSIRGYDYRSLSPQQNLQGRLINVGGENLLTGSLEYGYQFRPGWWGAGFIDAGNAYDNQFSNKTYVGIGAGLRFKTPVGPVRVDVAAGVSEDSVPIRLHFFIGPPL